MTTYSFNIQDAEKLLHTVKREQRGVIKVIKSYGKLTLGAYAKTLSENQIPPLQSREDLIRVAEQYVHRLLGKNLASALNMKLRETPVLLTANHHGVDYSRVQTSLLYALPSLQGPLEDSISIIPVFAFGSVSLNNPTFPQGILLSRKKRNSKNILKNGERFLKINIFPNCHKQSMVATAPAFTEVMVQMALKKIENLFNARKISQIEKDTLHAILQREYLKDEVLQLKNYTDQAVLLNHRLWKMVFSKGLQKMMPERVYLEMEQIVVQLLEEDIIDENSLSHRVLFDKNLRDAVVLTLNDKIACWHKGKLNKLLYGNLSTKERNDFIQQSGTIFFWGIDKRGRRIHLTLVSEDGKEWLKGIDDAGDVYKCLYTPEAIRNGLHQQKLLPGLFVVFLSVAFARGFLCLGGPFQVTYLPIMQAGLAKALFSIADYTGWAEKVAAVPTANFGSSMVFMLAKYLNEISPAGTVELLAKDGLHLEDLDKISTITVEDAILYFLLQSYQHYWQEKCDTSITDNISDYLCQKLPQLKF
jgi:hypothetical protein